MSEETGMEISLLVEHGREQEAADFYAAAFGAQTIDTHRIDGTLAGFAMRFGAMPVMVAGANPRREQDPSRGGPFFPKAAGAVSAVFTLHVGDIAATLGRALLAGATIRDPVETDVRGRRVGTLFDPFGHIWALVERETDRASQAA